MDDLADREWRAIRDGPRDGPTQMALEEAAAAAAVEEGLGTVRVFSWEPSTLSLGYREAPETVDWAFCEREGIDVTRRQTGGGGIYHDAYADISYTIVVPAAAVPGDLLESYALLCEPVLEAFSRMGIDAAFASEALEAVYDPACYLRSVNPAHDVVVDAGEGPRKISGNAQYRRRDVVIQHGSLSYALEPETHLGVFDGHGLAPSAFADRVTSIREEAGIDREAAVNALEGALADWCDAEAGAWRETELATAADLAERKYAAEAWVRDREQPDADT